jgi:hypothetical protein
MGRTYLDLCNEVINLMSYLPAKTMEDLNNPEGRLIKQKMNEVLREICCGEHGTWKFREREKRFTLAEGKLDYELPDGYILFIRPDDNTNRPPLLYNQQWRYLPLTTSGQPVYYWIYEDKIRLFPSPGKNQDGDVYNIRFLTDNYAFNKYGCEKEILEEADDEPIIPEQYRTLLVYGVVRDFRASMGDAKSEFYRRKFNALYNKMLSNQRLTDDYFKGGKVMGVGPTSLQAKIMAFKNPYATGDRIH